MKDVESIRSEIVTYAASLSRYMEIAEASGRYKLRQKIRLSDVELREYLEMMKAEILLLAIESVIWDAFLSDEEERKKGLMERLGFGLAGKKKLVERWREYVVVVKEHMNDKERKDEEKDREKGVASPEAAPGGPGRDVAGQE